MLSHAVIKRAILKSLSPDLLSREWKKRVQPGDPPETGHCAAPTEAFYYLCGGKRAGYKPVVCTYYEGQDEKIYFRDQNPPRGSLRSTHWWVRGPRNGEQGLGKIFDISVGQYKDTPFPYERGRGTGFQQPQKIPSMRAQIIMDRVEKILGRAALADFRRQQIDSYRQACRAKP